MTQDSARSDEKPIWQRRPSGSNSKHDPLKQSSAIATISEKVAEGEGGPDGFGGAGLGPGGKPRLYPRRWIMLVMFISLSMSNAFQWMEFAIIADIIQDFYGVTSQAVDWTSMIYMVTYIPFIFPAAWILDKYGLRIVALLGACGNALGAWIKCGAGSSHLFAVAFLGQAIVGTSQIFILGLPTRLAAVWFGPNEVSTACAMGVFGNQLGIAFGFLVPPLLVPSNSSMNETGAGLRNLYFVSAGLNSVLFLAILLFFKDKPPTAPSPAQIAAIDATVEKNFLQSLKSLLFNLNFILLIVTYGMNVGIFYAVSTLLNQMLIPIYPGKGIEIGQIGLLIVLAGMVGSIISGIWLDKTKKFKQTTFTVYVLSLVGMIIFTFTITLGKLWVVFVVAGLLGFFMTGYLPIGFEFGVEITYPVSEGTVSGLLNVSCQVFGMLETLIMGALMKKLSPLACNLACCGVLLVGSCLTLLIKSDLRRQNAGKIEDSSAADKLMQMDEVNGNLVKTQHAPLLNHTPSQLPILLDNDDDDTGGFDDNSNPPYGTDAYGNMVPMVTTGTQYSPKLKGGTAAGKKLQGILKTKRDASTQDNGSPISGSHDNLSNGFVSCAEDVSDGSVVDAHALLPKHIRLQLLAAEAQGREEML